MKIAAATYSIEDAWKAFINLICPQLLGDTPNPPVLPKKDPSALPSTTKGRLEHPLQATPKSPVFHVIASEAKQSNRHFFHLALRLLRRPS